MLNDSPEKPVAADVVAVPNPPKPVEEAAGWLIVEPNRPVPVAGAAVPAFGPFTPAA